MNANYCSICLEREPCITRLIDCDENNINWLTKLKSIVADLQDTAGEHSICNICMQQLDNFLIFRKRVETLVAKLNYIYKNENKYDEYFEEEDLTANSVLFQDECNDDSKDFDDEALAFRIEKYNSRLSPDTITVKEEQENAKQKLVKLEETFTCMVCDDEFESKKALRTHKKTCKINPKGSYTCYTCNKTYTTKSNLKIHHKKCGKEKTGNENIDKISKKRGRKSTRSYTCETCDGVFCLVKDLMYHCKTIHSIEEKLVKPYACNQCTQRFRTYAGYDQHLKYHSRNRDNVCSLCGKRFITKSELIVHEYTHFNRRNYKCTTCGKAFNTNKNLKTHILVVHTDRAAWKYACGICEKRFPQKGNYDQHMKRHAGDKQYICHICQKPFITSSELKRHINLHSNVKAFTCEYCQREYKTLRTLNTHLRRSHSVGDKLPEKEKKYVCHICPSQFYDKQKLSRHLYCHSGIKPFSCSACDKKFTDKSYLKHHLKVAHNIMNIPSEIKYQTETELKYEVPDQLKFEYDVK